MWIPKKEFILHHGLVYSLFAYINVFQHPSVDLYLPFSKNAVTCIVNVLNFERLCAFVLHLFLFPSTGGIWWAEVSFPPWPSWLNFTYTLVYYYHFGNMFNIICLKKYHSYRSKLGGDIVNALNWTDCVCRGIVRGCQKGL